MRPVRTSREFGAAVRQARKDKGMTQQALAAGAGVSRPWLSQLESGKRTAELGRALWVLDALGLAVSLVPDSPCGGTGFDLDGYVDGWNHGE